jgi:CheY-like chemotaxis protein
MMPQPKILLVDDDQDFLDLYKEMLTQHLSCLPDVRTVASGQRALAVLESEPFNLMIVDLHMPKMDGLQVLSIARRKWPHLRLVVLTGIRDEQFRTRAYAMGVDQYWIKPETDHEMGLFMESIESILASEAQGGFRGVQSKSLVDIIQLECLAQSSCLLKITNGMIEGKIWIQNGEVIHAAASGMSAEPAFQKILSWKTGCFEVLPADTNQTRTIFTSYQGLLLNTAQAIDEEASQNVPIETGSESHSTTAPLLAEFSQYQGVEFVLAVNRESNTEDFWGLDNPKPMADWMRQTLEGFQALGEELRAGEIQQIVATGPQWKAAIASCGQSRLCVGFPPAFPAERVRETMTTMLTKWAS